MPSKPTLPGTLSQRQQPVLDPGPSRAQLQERREALEAEVDALRRSISWRLTAPLRRANRWLRRSAGPASETVIGQRDDYAEWIRRYDSPGVALDAGPHAEAAALPGTPLFSLLMPVSDLRSPWLAEAVDAVRSQRYAGWELCLAVDASSGAEASALLDRLDLDDARIKVVPPLGGAGCVASALNGALGIASGAWVLPTDPDDLIPVQALQLFAAEIASHPGARMVYSDEDRIDARGRRYSPYFKPDWNLDLLRSQDLFSRLGAFDASLARQVGGFRPGFEGAEVHDFALRCIEALSPDQVRHIPRVLCHRRSHGESTALSHGAEPSAPPAGARALNDHLRRLGIAGTAEALPEGYRVHYDLPVDPPLVTLVIPTRNAEALVRQCVESIVAATTYPHYEILLVDNGSDDPAALAYFAELDAQPGITVLRDDRPFNYAALNNRAVAQARGEFVALVNNDIEVITPDWLGEMVSLACQQGVGAVGAKLLYPDQTLQHAGIVLGVAEVAGHAHKHLPAWLGGHGHRARLMQSFSAVTAACLVVRKDLYEQVGGLNDADLKVAYNDVDFCLKLRDAGYRNVWTPYAVLFHHESATRGSDMSGAQRERLALEQAYMRERWGALIANDPAYNPNLTLDAEDFGLAWPPRVTPNSPQ